MKLSHSYSAIKLFENCPLRYYRQRIVKDVVDKGSDASKHGERIHAFLENRLKGSDLPQEIERYEPLCAGVEKAARNGTLLIEHELVLTDELTPTGWWDADAWLRSKLDVLIVAGTSAVVLDWKGLALDTKIPTPAGWTTMGDIAVGDTVFDAAGKQCRVVGKSKIKNIGCYRITFDDTTTVVCDEEHLWKLRDGAVVGVKDLMGKKHSRQRYNPPRIAVADPLDMPEVALPIHPYVLGLWLADGNHSSGAISKPDPFVWQRIQECGYKVDMSTGGSKACPTRTVQGLRTALIATGLYKHKHIPPMFLRASFAQRIALLQGLMDGDGNANPTRKQAIFTTTDKRLSDDVCELLSSLGQRPLQSTTTQRGFGLTVTAYPVSFRPQRGINPFSLPRKADRVSPLWGPGQSDSRIAISVEEIPSVPTQCIAVDSEDHTFLCTERMVPTHNTGKRNLDSFQMELFAAQVFKHFPEVERVKTSLVWLKTLEMDTENYVRADANAIWAEVLKRIHRIEAAYDNAVWPARPSGLCKYCPCNHDCKFARK
jgi:hypothetical protein